MEHKATKTERVLCDVITSMDAQMKAKDARIAELEADVTASEQRGYAKAMEAERLLYDHSLNIVWNDAIEAAASEIDCGGQCGACGSHGHCYSELAATIYALKRN